MNEKSNETIRQSYLYEKNEVVSIIEGYKSLNYDGAMQSFLHKASSCRKCEELPIKVRPINRLVNELHLDRTPEDEADEIIQRYDIFKKRFIRQPYNVIDEFNQYKENIDDEKFYQEVMGNRWLINGGLSIGVCGWTDASILLSKGKHEIMIIAADWYPMRSQTTFIIEREDFIFRNQKNFPNKLFPGIQQEEKTEKWNDLLSKAGVYFTNAMLCYRPQTAKVGQTNISAKSFEFCQNLLKDQINIVKPKLIVTWGIQPAISAFNALLEIAQNKTTTEIIKKTFFSPFQLTKLGAHPELPPFRIPVEWGEVLLHPICHPSMPNRWGKQGNGQYLDYGRLQDWIKREYKIY
jgi:hypothetical protein